MPTLQAATLSALSIPVPGYDRSRDQTGIVHFGVGGFHRAHQAMYLDQLMEQGEALEWGITGVGVMPFDLRMRYAMAAQECLHAGGQRRRRRVGTKGHRLHRQLPLRPGRSRGGDRGDGRPDHPGSLRDRDRGGATTSPR